MCKTLIAINCRLMYNGNVCLYALLKGGEDLCGNSNWSTRIWHFVQYIQREHLSMKNHGSLRRLALVPVLQTECLRERKPGRVTG